MGATETEKHGFGSILGVFCAAFEVFLCTLGMFFNELFVCMRLCGHRVFKVVSHVMLPGIPLCFSALQSNSPTRKKTDRSEKRPSSSSRDGFLRIHDATTFVFIQSQLAPHFIAFRHCRLHGSLFDILYDLK